MGAVHNPSRVLEVSETRRPWSVSKVVDLLLATVAHGVVMAAWAITVLTVMGSLSVGRMMVMNSEFAWDTGRLPQPWLLPIGIAAIAAAHRFFGWSMRRFTGSEAAYGPSALAWAGAWAGAVVGAYLWYPPIEVGRQIGPHSGQSTPWGPLAWIAHYARLAIPAAMTVVTAAVWLFSKHSPVVVAWKNLRRAFINRRGRRIKRRKAA